MYIFLQLKFASELTKKSNGNVNETIYLRSKEKQNWDVDKEDYSFGRSFDFKMKGWPEGNNVCKLLNFEFLKGYYEPE